MYTVRMLCLKRTCVRIRYAYILHNVLVCIDIYGFARWRGLPFECLCYMGLKGFLTSLFCRWQTRATQLLMPTMLCAQMSTVGVINWWPTQSPVYHTDRPPKLTAPEMISRSRDMVGAHQNLNASRDLTTPLSGMFAIHGLALATVNVPIKFEVSNSSHYEDKKGDTKCRKCGGLG